MIEFTKYIRLVLPVDGYVFWVRADLVSKSALLNAAQLNSFTYNQPVKELSSAAVINVKGSLHYATQRNQEEAETYERNRVIFTSETEIEDLNEIGPAVLFIGEFEGLKFAFSTRQNYYQQADIHHYEGDAVYPDMELQLVDKLEGFDATNAIVSNSLPFWLAMNGYQKAEYEDFGNPSLQLFPSYLAPNNLVPPYGIVHITPEATRAIASTPTLTKNLTHLQLAADRVKITLWGTRNFTAQDFVDFVNQYSLNTDNIGIMNMPIMRDEKRTQSELGTISQKKTIEYEVSYYQQRARDVARQLIITAFPTYYLGDRAL